MRSCFRLCVCFFILLAAWMISCQAENWTDCPQVSDGFFRYDITVPEFEYWLEEDWDLKASYVPEAADPRAMQLSLKVVDRYGSELTNAQIADALGEYGRFVLYLPFPAGHDAASGYEYSIVNAASGAVIGRNDYSTNCISFDMDRAAPLGPYRVSWSDVQTPISVPWGLLMTKMDWDSPSCSYTVGAGDKTVSVVRSGSDVRISGGAISDVVRLTTTDQGEADYQSIWGWHVPSGSYTFSDIVFEYDDMYVWAYAGEDYKITLEDSVRTSFGIYCDLDNGAEVEIINHAVIESCLGSSLHIYMDTSCSLHISGSGRILPGAEESADAGFGCVLLTPAADNEEAIENIRKFEGNVTVDFDLVSRNGDYPAVHCYCGYLPDPDDPWYCEDVIDPDTGEPYRLPATYFVKKSASDAEADVLILPADLTRIESEAFRGVTVSTVVIPPSVTFIADDAFVHSSIRTVRGSTEYVREYAAGHGFAYSAAE